MQWDAQAFKWDERSTGTGSVLRMRTIISPCFNKLHQGNRFLCSSEQRRLKTPSPEQQHKSVSSQFIVRGGEFMRCKIQNLTASVVFQINLNVFWSVKPLQSLIKAASCLIASVLLSKAKCENEKSLKSELNSEACSVNVVRGGDRLCCFCTL